ncbi:MAG: DUF2062 domain-containing protein [Victivallaceae bacterium]|nr:DUF2062 domain-containing protein [Victivallaceae bacterium]
MKQLLRLVRYYYLKMVREHGTPEYIARGWALGMAVGFVVPIGIQLVVAVPLSFVLRGSKIGAALGTCITNHFTVLVIYPVQCYLGNKIIGGDLSFAGIRAALGDVFREKTFDSLIALGDHLLWSFFAGGILLAAIATLLTYWGVRRLVSTYRRIKERKLKIRRRKLQPRSPAKQKDKGSSL